MKLSLEKEFYHMALGKQGFSVIPYRSLMDPMSQLNLDWVEMYTGVTLSALP